MKVYNVLALPRSGHNHILFNLFDTTLNQVSHLHNESYYYSLQLTDKVVYFTPWGHHTYIEDYYRHRIEVCDYLIIDNQECCMINIPYRYPNDFPYKINHTIIILRDYFNNLASIVQQRQRYLHRLINYIPEFNKAWKKLANEILYGKLNKTTILYNNWISSEKYRKSIYKQLDLAYNFTNIVPHNGSGSSFNDNDYLNRFNQVNQSLLKELLDYECIELNRKLFKVYGPSYIKYPWWVRLKRWYNK